MSDQSEFEQDAPDEDTFDQWDDLFLSGGFAPRSVLLAGLSFEQTAMVPEGAPHSIYQELWHAATVLRMSLDQGRVALGGWPLAQHFPARAEPRDAQEWEELVSGFLAASAEAVARSKEPGWLESPDPGFEQYDLTWRDALEFLAVHTAYHMGRIVLLRQLIGAWPPGRAAAT